MNIDFLLDRFQENKQKAAVVWEDKEISYEQLIKRIDTATSFLNQYQIQKGEVVSVSGDFTPNSIALLLALILNDNIIAPFNVPIKNNDLIKFEIACVQKKIRIDLDTDELIFEGENDEAEQHDYLEVLRERKTAGLILFTSGTSGFPKGAVHDFGKLLEKFKAARKSLRTINFLLFDHWGGLNTLFHTLSNCGLVLPLKDRKPEAVCQFVETYKIELLPVSPSFLNLLLLSEIYKKYDLSSLTLITYGSEPMPANTLKRAKELFPNIRFQQTYGLIELGVLRSKSKDDDSLWVKLGGEGYDLRVVDNMLEIKAESAMLGYLNADSPFTKDGYFMTGDLVEQEGEYFKILGRQSELINVGGEKVYPQEVENVILQIPNILDVTVYGEPHVMMGNIVRAKVYMKEFEEARQVVKEIKKFCKERLQSFKVPVKIEVQSEPLHNERFKKRRKL